MNDAGDETEGVFYESLVRRILGESWQPAVVMLFSVFANDWNLRPRLAPIGLRNQVPMVDVLEAVSPQFDLPPEGGRVVSKRQYFYDVYHPSNLGHQIMADCLLHLLDALDLQQPDLPTDKYIPPWYGDGFAPLCLLDRKDCPEGAAVDPGSFTGTDTDLQRVPLDFDRENTPMFPYNWSKGEGDAPFVLELKCKKLALVFKDSGDPRFGKARVRMDGAWSRLLDPRDAGWTHCNTVVLFDRQESAAHRVEISMDPAEGDRRFTILGFGYVP